MPKPRKILFLLTDGGRARLVRRSPETGDYVTLEELDHTEQLKTLRAELRASPPARSFISFSAGRHTVGREDYYRQAKETFAAEAARLAEATMSRQGLDEIFLAAPPRMIGMLRAQFGPRVHVAGTLNKDLTKTPNHALHAWLDEALFAVRAAG